MYSYQIIVTFYDDVYADNSFIMDTDGLLYLAPFFIIILSIVYLIRIKIFDRIYGIDLSEIDETEVSVFSNMSEKDRKEIKAFRQKEEQWQPIEEEYYRNL